MSKYYLFSGIDKVIGFTKRQAQYLKKDLNKEITITFIASSFDNYDVNDNYYNNTLIFFDKIKVKIKTSYLIDGRITKKQAINCINNSDAVFIMGGVPSEEMQSIVEYGLVKELKKFDGIIMGVSAGSINMNKNISYIDKNGNITEYQGIGLTDYNIAPHLDFKKEQYIKEIYIISEIKKTIGLPNDSFIIIENDKEKIVGDYYYFYKGTYQHNKKID